MSQQVGNIQNVMFDDYEASKVVYTTPSFSGFGVSASFTPAANSADNCCGALNGNSTEGGGPVHPLPSSIRAMSAMPRSVPTSATPMSRPVWPVVSMPA